MSGVVDPGEPGPNVPLWLKGVSKWYGPVIGVNEMTFRVEGGVAAIVGPNGAGKSTLMKLLTGQLRPGLGAVRVFGRSVRSAAARARLGYCPDVDAFYEEMTGRRFVYTMLRLTGFPHRQAEERTDAALHTVGMTDADGVNRADKRLRGCSKGMRQRIKLAQAIAHDPDLLILDEPLSGLDPIGRRDFCALFRKLADEGKTLLVSSHVLSEIENLADRVLLVAQGRLLTQGTWPEVARYLDDLPQEVTVRCKPARALAGRLIEWPGVQKVVLRGDDECILSTRDPGGLCDEIGRLVRDEGYRVDRLSAERPWADALFAAARGD
ncbi:MAG: ABC transporter ATP-binding protein [Planctomycetia bacterium]